MNVLGEPKIETLATDDATGDDEPLSPEDVEDSYRRD